MIGPILAQVRPGCREAEAELKPPNITYRDGNRRDEPVCGLRRVNRPLACQNVQKNIAVVARRRNRPAVSHRTAGMHILELRAFFDRSYQRGGACGIGLTAVTLGLLGHGWICRCGGGIVDDFRNRPVRRPSV